MYNPDKISINYDAIRALEPKGSNVQSDDGQTWEIVTVEATKKYVIHVNFNGTMNGIYIRTYQSARKA